MLAAERIFGSPQDVEWAIWQGQVFILQARPISGAAEHDGIFSQASPAGILWTSGFLNERFHQPVSPLGWSLLRPAIEQFAFRETLQFLGTPRCDMWRLTRLYRGHPYTDVRVFQTIYKVFPDALLPEDAARFFINRDVEQRRKVPYPLGLFDPRFLISMLLHFVHDARNWSPLHNARLWEKFARRYDAMLERNRRQAEGASPSTLLWVVANVQNANGRLLSIHRWSLTDAEVFYSLLRRLLARWVDPDLASDLAAALTSGTGNLSLATNQALDVLARLARTVPALVSDDGTLMSSGQMFMLISTQRENLAASAAGRAFPGCL